MTVATKNSQQSREKIPNATPDHKYWARLQKSQKADDTKAPNLLISDTHVPFSANSPKVPVSKDAHLAQTIMDSVMRCTDQAVILLDGRLKHVYNNIKYLKKETPQPSASDLPGSRAGIPGSNGHSEPQKIHMENTWDEIFDKDYLSRTHSASKPPLWSNIFSAPSDIRLSAEYSCLKQIIKMYEYVRPSRTIPQIEKIIGNINAKKRMGLRSWTDDNSRLGDFGYHRDGLFLVEFVNLLTKFVSKYTGKDNSKRPNRQTRAVNGLLRGSTLEFYFSYLTFNITISVINISPAKEKNIGPPYVIFFVLNMSEKYKLNFIDEENKFKNLLLKSIQHELNTPINFV
jgi:hypothetical protein